MLDTILYGIGRVTAPVANLVLDGYDFVKEDCLGYENEARKKRTAEILAEMRGRVDATSTETAEVANAPEPTEAQEPAAATASSETEVKTEAKEDDLIHNEEVVDPEADLEAVLGQGKKKASPKGKS
jgi:hypothetical protein